MKSVTRLSYVITGQLFADEICDPSYLRDYRAAVCGLYNIIM